STSSGGQHGSKDCQYYHGPHQCSFGYCRRIAQSTSKRTGSVIAIDHSSDVPTKPSENIPSPAPPPNVGGPGDLTLLQLLFIVIGILSTSFLFAIVAPALGLE